MKKLTRKEKDLADAIQYNWPYYKQREAEKLAKIYIKKTKGGENLANSRIHDKSVHRAPGRMHMQKVPDDNIARPGPDAVDD